ncbi:SDR family NAD(P)-dependent oxidoreductase [Runella sp.]|uniref:SDR family NAD(P)-dependent oxidoreductase n=1 Tax=Runella sp. TaxID=1960881 RepID=UPI003D09B329
MINRLIIITGSSRGIGKATAEIFLKGGESDLVIGVARTAATETVPNFKGIQADLSHLEGCENLLSQLAAFIAENTPQKLILVNNAGRLGEVVPSYQTPPSDLAKTIFLNMTAPMILQNGLLTVSVEKAIPLEIVNISSGAAKHEYYGWSGYCSTKAGFLMAAQVLKFGNKSITS